MIRRLAHASFVTDDLPAMHRFYTQVLGLAVQIELRTEAGEVFGFYFNLGETSFIEVYDDRLKQQTWGVPGRPDRRGGKFDHLCLEVTDMDAIVERLKANGVAIDGPFRGNGGTHIVWIADPDGNRYELMQYVATSPQLQRPGPAILTIKR